MAPKDNLTDKTPLKQVVDAVTYDPDATESSNSGDGHNNDGNNDHHDAVHDKFLIAKLILAAGAASATLGYDVGIMADAILPLAVDMDLNSVQKEFALGSLNFVAAFGALLGGKIADKEGRKETLKWCGWIFILGAAFMALAVNYAMLLSGRIFTGVGVGVAVVVSPIYITEIAPSDQRGKLNTVFDASINLGILLGYITGYIVHVISPGNWRVMLACGAILPIIVLVLLTTLPESPRWSMLMNRPDEALYELKRLGHDEEESKQIVRDMEQEVQKDQERPIDLWGPGLRMAVGYGFFQQVAGSEAVLYYTADFLAQAGLNSPSGRLLGNCFVGICKLVPECFTMYFIDTVGRRPIMLASGVALTFFLAAISFAFHVHANATVIIVLLCCVMASYSIGIGPFTFLCVTENLSVSERALGTTYCATANRATSGIVALTVVSLYDVLGLDKLFGIYALLRLGSLVFYWSASETAGLTLEEIQAARAESERPTSATKGELEKEEAMVSLLD